VSESRAPDSVVPWRVFGAVAAFVAVLAAIYWFTSYEQAGTAMLVLASVLSLWASAYLWRSSSHQNPEEHEDYLPHESVWPFAIGLGAFLLLNGLLVGGWFFLPGGVVMAGGVAGWVRQSRART
jgi:hypothetical protein